MNRAFTIAFCVVLAVSGMAVAQQVFEPSDAVTAVYESPNLSGSVTFSGMTASTMIYLDSAKILTSTSAPTNGQVLIGNTGNAPTIGSIAGTTNQITVTAGPGTITLSTPQNTHTGASPTFAGITLTGPEITSQQTVTIPNDGAGTSPGATITPTSSLVLVDCQDANNCTATMDESGMTSGQLVRIVVTSANTVSFSDSAGVSELAGAFTAGAYDALSLIYVTDRWVEHARSNN